MTYTNYKIYIGLLFTALFAGCIENDLPYPTVNGVIEQIETKGLVSAIISKEQREVSLTVADTIDLKDIQITKFVVSANTKVLADSLACKDIKNFPDTGFISIDSLPATANTRINISIPARFVLRTYQDYEWKITAKQDIKRIFNITDSLGNAIIIGSPVVDEKNRQVVVYVEDGTNLGKIKVNELRLGSSIAKTEPEPSTVTDFRRARRFEVTAFGVKEEWTVSLVTSKESPLVLTPWSRRAYLTGGAKEGTPIVIQYRKQGETEWDRVFDDEITFAEDGFTATMRHLSPGTIYEYSTAIAGSESDIRTFSTDTIALLPNAGFENWQMYRNETLSTPMTAWAVFGEGEKMFWDSGNWGSATLSKYITEYDEEVLHGGKRSARLKSQFVGALGIGKFAAGNLFIGQYIATDGMDGILDFGRPFEGRPSTLKGWFKYKTIKLDKYVSEELAEVEDAQKGMNDKATIYIALGDWDKPVNIRTKKDERKLFDKNDPHIIAYQEMEIGESVNNWTEFKLKLDYRSLTRKPKYLLIVSSASKYGDFFTGGDGSTLWIDDFELVYE